MEPIIKSADAEFTIRPENMQIPTMGSSICPLVGSLSETQKVLEFCAQHHIQPRIQMISMQGINDAFDKVKNEDVRFGYVIYQQTVRSS